MTSSFENINDVVASQLCLGCGACQPACPSQAIELFDVFDEGIRPVAQSPTECGNCMACVEVCPGISTDFRYGVTDKKLYGEKAAKDWGPILEIWEGHAADQNLRYKGSSGGVLTALAAYGIEKAGLHGVLHTGQDPNDPSRNSTRLSRSRSDLMAAMGSRYSPASVCNGLKLIENAPAACAFIGKPSEIAALRKSQAINPALDSKVGIAMTFFCAETPPTKATHLLSEKLGVSPNELADLKYRGDGWPGYFAPTRKGEQQPAAKITYTESWAFLQALRPWATHLWPDGGGELADISCGDPWYKQPDRQNPGSSLIVVRTERGRTFLKGAIEAGYVELKSAELWKLDHSQENLLKKKGATWGRIISMHTLGMATPRFVNTNLFHCWLSLPLTDKLRSTFGTIRRIFHKRIHRPPIINTMSHSSKRIAQP